MIMPVVYMLISHNVSAKIVIHACEGRDHERENQWIVDLVRYDIKSLNQVPEFDSWFGYKKNYVVMVTLLNESLQISNRISQNIIPDNDRYNTKKKNQNSINPAYWEQKENVLDLLYMGIVISKLCTLHCIIRDNTGSMSWLIFLHCISLIFINIKHPYKSLQLL